MDVVGYERVDVLLKKHLLDLAEVVVAGHQLLLLHGERLVLVDYADPSEK